MGDSLEKNPKRPAIMVDKHSAPLRRLSSPLRLFFSLLLIIFGTEMLIMFIILPKLFENAEGVAATIVDASLLALLVAPFLWLRIVRPLRNAALKEEAWTKTVLENVVDGVALLNQEGIIESFNAAAQAMFGYSAPEVTGMQMKSLLPNGEIIFGNEERGVGSNPEIDGQRKDGFLFPLDLSISRVCIGEQRMFICIMRDISQRKQAEQEICRLNAKLEQKLVELTQTQENLLRKEKLATLGQLSGSVGHELRNPLGVMSNAVYFLKMVLTDADETTKEYLDIIKQEIETSQRIISDLLDFARTKPPLTKTIRANELIERSIGRCTIPGCVTLRSEIPETRPPLLVDPQQIGQVLQNLITNGIQAMPDGGVLRIAARLKLDGDFVEISVTDTGEGISPENMKKLFQPLFTTKAKGIGLGLVVCRNLVEANGGRIEVESRPGEGTTFAVILPVERGDT